MTLWFAVQAKGFFQPLQTEFTPFDHELLPASPARRPSPRNPPPLSEAMRQWTGRAGAFVAAGQLFFGKSRNRRRQSNGPTPAAFQPLREIGHLPAHGRVAVAVGVVRLQTPARQVARAGLPAVVFGRQNLRLHPGRAQDARPPGYLGPLRPNWYLGERLPAAFSEHGR